MLIIFCQMAKYNKYDLYDLVTVIKAMADKNRVRLLFALKKQKLCVCQLTEMLGLAPSTVSKHISLLKSARLVESQKQGRWVYYSLSEKRISPIGKEAVKWLFHFAGDTEEIEKDQQSLNKILKIDPEILCRMKKIK